MVKNFRTLYSQTSVTRSRGDHFHKSEAPEVRIKFALRVILTCENSQHTQVYECKETKKRNIEPADASKIPLARAIRAQAIEI